MCTSKQQKQEKKRKRENMRHVSYHSMWHAAGSCGNRPCTKSHAYVCMHMGVCWNMTHTCAYACSGFTLGIASGSAYAATFNYSRFGGELLTPDLPYPTANNVIYCRNDHCGLQWVNLLSELSSYEYKHIHAYIFTYLHAYINEADPSCSAWFILFRIHFEIISVFCY